MSAITLAIIQFENLKIVYLYNCGKLLMEDLTDLRVCMDCGTVYSKDPSSMKKISKCPNCNSIRRRGIFSEK